MIINRIQFTLLLSVLSLAITGYSQSGEVVTLAARNSLTPVADTRQADNTLRQSQAQSFFPAGYIITKDTIRGKFQSDNVFSYRTSLMFQPNGGEWTTYTPDEVSFFFVENTGGFKSVAIKNPDQSQKQKQFVFVLEEGKAELYSLSDHNQRYFVAKDGELYELEQVKRQVVNSNGGVEMRIDYNYRGTLGFIFKDCVQKVDLLPFSRRDIQMAVHKYNICADPNHRHVYSIKGRGIKIKHYVGAKVNFNLPTVDVTKNPFDSKAFGSMSVSSFIGYGAFYRAQISKSLNIKLGMDYYSFSAHTTSPVNVKGVGSNPNSQGTFVGGYDFSLLMMPIEFMNTWAVGAKGQVFMSVGYTVLIPQKTQFDFTFTPTAYNQYYDLYYASHLTGNLKVTESQCYSIGTGYMHKLTMNREITAAIRYLPNTVNSNISFNTIELSVAFSGRLGKN